MNMSLSGKVALVTGCDQLLGRAAALLLAQRGAKVAVNYLMNAAAAEALVSELRAGGCEAVALHADIRQEDQAHKLVAAVKAYYGSVDILVSSVNISLEAKPFAEISWGEFIQVTDGELKSAFMATKAVIPLMIEQRIGRIIYISSTEGKEPTPYMIALGTAKGGLNTFAMYIAQEFGPQGITANVVATGFMQDGLSEEEQRIISQFTPLRRVAEPDDVAGAIAFLASDDARFVTGTYTPVTGGLSME
jgi:3-oxoacyl-[acyl-carrier protein] reductase